MAQVIDLAKFTFNGDTLKGVGELTFELMADSRNALQFVSTFGNIKVEKEVGFLGKGGLVGKAASGCTPTAQNFSVPTRLVKWTPADWEVLLHLCYKDLDGTIAEYCRKSGVKKPDFTQSDYEAIVEMVLARALNDFLWRFIWFMDKDAANVASGGVITDGTDVSYFNLIDGAWKQIFAAVTAGEGKHITIAANAETTYAKQVITPAQAKSLLEDMFYAAPVDLRKQPDRAFYVTQNIYDAYEQYLSDVQNIPLETIKSNLIEGIDVLKIHGVEVIAMPEWDDNIAAYEDNGASLHLPFRAIYTCKSCLGVGFDDEVDFTNVECWYDRDDRKVKIEGMGNGDAKLLHPGLIVSAY